MKTFFTRLQSIRLRLLASYILLLVVTLTIMLGAVVVTTGARSAPPQQTWLELSALMRGFDWDTFVRQIFGRSSDAQNVRVAMDTYSERSGIRLIWFEQIPNNDGPPVVRHDTASVFTSGQPLDRRLTLQRDTNRQLINNGTIRAENVEGVFGEFEHDGTRWLFTGLMRGPLSVIGEQRDEPTIGLIAASPRPQESIQDVLAAFGDDLFLPILQAGLVGLGVAVLMAWIISRTIARPLQALNHAAKAFARGELDHRAPETGPKEVRAVAEAFNHMSEEVVNTQQSQHDFLANVSHDLKTPLTSIQGYSQAIIDGTVKQPEKAASIIYDEAARLTRMVIALTDLARIQAGQFSLNMNQLDVSDVVKAVVQRLEMLAANKDITLTVQTPPLPHIAGDGDRLVQVFNNLVGNALKYTPDGGKVDVVTRQATNGVDVVIRDTGIGIPKKDLPRIFERFYQVDKARGPKRGTGLGLAITHEIVQAHGGTIDVQSIEGHGTQFIVWLPSAHKAQTAIHRTIPRPG
jgi:signal transduction histidine kinase